MYGNREMVWSDRMLDEAATRHAGIVPEANVKYVHISLRRCVSVVSGTIFHSGRYVSCPSY